MATEKQDPPGKVSLTPRQQLPELSRAIENQERQWQQACRNVQQQIETATANAKIAEAVQHLTARLRAEGLDEADGDFWLRLWAVARQDLGLSYPELMEMSPREFFALLDRRKVIEDRGAQAIVEALRRTRVKAGKRRAGPAGDAALRKRVGELRDAGLSHKEICGRLDGEKMPRPARAAWRDLTWTAAYRDQEHSASVKKWISSKTVITV